MAIKQVILNQLKPSHLVGSLVCLVFLDPQPSFADESHLSYWLDSSLIYADHLKRPNTSSDNLPYSDHFKSDKSQSPAAGSAQSLIQNAQNQARTLGLRSFKIGVQTRDHGSSNLKAIFRPDATLDRHEDGLAKEYDDRSGNTYRSSPAIKFLDTYHISLNLGPGTKIQAGVFEAIAPIEMSYLSRLGFGLWTILPQKVSGIKVRFDMMDPPSPKAQQEALQGAKYEIWIHNGRRDRAEVLGYQSDTFDQAPSSQDTYTGLAFSGHFLLADASHFKLHLGYGDEKIEYGRINEYYSSIQYIQNLTFDDLKILLSIDARRAKERFHVDVGRFHSLVQQSISITNRLNWNEDYSVLVGGHIGQSDRSLEDTSRIETLRGWQLDVGASHHPNSNIDLTSMIAIESRKSDLAGATDGFRGPTDSTAYLLRIALEIRYTLDRL